MDTALTDDIRQRMKYELSRNTAPEDFPQLPDIPLERYTSQEIFDLEVKRLFGHSWLMAGHTSEFAGPGSYRTLDTSFGSVVVVRGEDGELRAFRNACRHRGAPVVASGQGTVERMVCRFHSWSYDLTGRLRGVPDKRDFIGLDLDARGLVQIGCDSWGGFVFVNFNSSAMTLQEWLAPFVARFEVFANAPLRVVRRRSVDIACNWKTVVEAFLEVYHFKTVHPNTVAHMLDGRGCVVMLHDNGHSSMYIPYRQVDASVDEMKYRLDDIPAIEGLSDWYSEANASTLMYPNLIFNVEATGFPLLQFWPVDLGHTRYEEIWLGVDWGEGERPAGWDLRLGGWDFTVEEDLMNLEAIQLALKTAAHGGIPLSYQERRIWHFHQESDRLIGPDRIRPDLRIPELLADRIEP